MSLVAGRIKRCCNSKPCSSPSGFAAITPTAGVPIAGTWPPHQHVVGKRRTQQLERKHLTLRTRIKRLVRKTICFSRSVQMHDIVIGLFINRFEFGVQSKLTNQLNWYITHSESHTGDMAPHPFVSEHHQPDSKAVAAIVPMLPTSAQDCPGPRERRRNPRDNVSFSARRLKEDVILGHAPLSDGSTKFRWRLASVPVPSLCCPRTLSFEY